MSSQFTQTTNQGCLSRILGSFIGVLIGFLMIPGSVILLSWNEYRTIHRSQGLSEAEKVVVEVPDPMEIDTKQEGRLVHLTGKATTEELLKDREFSVNQVALRLERDVEMYQWVEKKESRSRDKLGGGRETVTTYTYDRKWHSGHENSDQFQDRTGHENPPPRYTSASEVARQATLGAFAIRPSMVERIDEWRNIPVDLTTMLESFDEQTRAKFSADGDRLYYSNSVPKPNSPEVGDLRIRFRVVEPTQVSVLAKQMERKLEPFQTTNKETIEGLAVGARSAQEMVDDMRKENSLFAILFRLLGWVLACVGIGMIIGPIKAFANVVPLFGKLVGVATGAIAFILGSVIALVTIAVAWIAVRPLFSIGMIAFAAIGLYVLLKKRKTSEPPMAVLADRT